MKVASLCHVLDVYVAFVLMLEALKMTPNLTHPVLCRQYSGGEIESLIDFSKLSSVSPRTPLQETYEGSNNFTF